MGLQAWDKAGTSKGRPGPWKAGSQQLLPKGPRDAIKLRPGHSTCGDEQKDKVEARSLASRVTTGPGGPKSTSHHRDD